MTGEVIKSFLVGLGFDVDESDLAKFNKAITSATIKVTAFSTAIVATASSIGYAIADMSKDFEDLGYQFRIISPAINKALVLRNEMLKAYSATGMNMTQVITNAVKLNMSLEKTKFILSALYKSVGSRFFEQMTKQSDQFRALIYKNLPKIQNSLEKFIKFVFKSLEVVTELGTRLWSILSRVYDFFVMLDKATDGWSTIILGVIAAWKLLNLSFLATPLGMIIAGLVAILALFDDFKTWQEGGKSLFDWSSFVPVIESVKNVLTSVWGVLQSIGQAIGAVVSSFVSLLHGDFKGFFSTLSEVAGTLINVLSKLWDMLKNIVGLGGSVGHWIAGLGLGDKISGLFGGGNAAANIQNNPVGRAMGNPVGSNVENANTNMNVQQQTSINVTGSADANKTGQAVASQQGRVNRDLVDNMRGSTR